MDYATETLAFIDWLETNPLEPTTQTLWMHLMVLAKKSGYPEWFIADNPLLMAKVGVTENTLSKHRNYLIQRGRIEYKSQGKKKPGKYRMVPINSNNDVECAVNHEAKRAVNHEAKGAAYKDLKDSSFSSSSSGANESFYAAHKRVFGFECNPFQTSQLGSYIDDDGMDEAVVVRSIERAGEVSSKYNFKLIRRIVDDYFKSGVRTLEQAIAIDAAYDGRKQNAAAPRSRQQKKSFSEIAEDDYEQA